MCNWKSITGYEGLYEINEIGEVRSLHKRYNQEPNVLKQGIGSKGYKNVTLCKNGKQTTVNVHRLVALAFIPNPNHFPCINHKNEDKTDNNVSNLEWCSYYQNNVYGSRLTKASAKISIPVKCIETDTIYSNAYSAQRLTNIHQSNISMCCHGKRKTAGGYHWSFVSPPQV